MRMYYGILQLCLHERGFYRFIDTPTLSLGLCFLSSTPHQGLRRIHLGNSIHVSGLRWQLIPIDGLRRQLGLVVLLVGFLLVSVVAARARRGRRMRRNVLVSRVGTRGWRSRCSLGVPSLAAAQEEYEETCAEEEGDTTDDTSGDGADGGRGVVFFARV